MSKKFKALMLALSLIATPVMSIPVVNTTSVEAQAATKKKVTYTDTQKKIAKALAEAKQKRKNFKVQGIFRVYYKMDIPSDTYDHYEDVSFALGYDVTYKYKYLTYLVFYTYKDDLTGAIKSDYLYINRGWTLLDSLYWEGIISDFPFCVDYTEYKDDIQLSLSYANKVNQLLKKY